MQIAALSVNAQIPSNADAKNVKVSIDLLLKKNQITKTISNLKKGNMNMIILNEFVFWEAEAVFAALTSFSVFLSIISVILAIVDFKKSICFICITILLIVSSVFTFNETPRTPRYQIYLDTMPYQELIEEYCVVETNGAILTVEKKQN